MRSSTKSLMSLLLLVVLLLGTLPSLAQDELTETYGLPEGGLIISYSSDWVLEELMPGEGITLATDQAAIDAQQANEALPEGTALFSIYGPELISQALGIDLTDSDLTTALEALIDVLAPPSQGVEFGDVEPAQVAEYKVVTVQYATNGNDGVAFLVDFDGSYVYISVKALAGTLPQHKTLIYKLIGAMEYIPADTAAPPLGELTENYVFPSGTYAVSYPDDWATMEHPGGEFIIATSQDAIDALLELPADGSQGGAPILFRSAVIVIREPLIATQVAPSLGDATSLANAMVVVATMEEWDLTAIENITIAGHPAIVIPAQAGFQAVIDFDGEYMVINAIDGLGWYEDHVLTILDTLTPTTPD